MKTPPSKKNTKPISSQSVFSGYVALVRPVNALMASVGVFLGYCIATQSVHFTTTLLHAMLAVFFISGGGQAINDYFDLAIDQKQKNTRPLASGLISPKMGLVFALALFALGIVLASFINQDALYMAGFFSLLLIGYSGLMSKIKFMGNLIVAVSVGFTYIFGATAASITPLVVLIAIPAMLANWAREIIKDAEDKDVDKGHKITLPHILKAREVNVIVFILLAATVFSGYGPVILGITVSPLYIGLTSVANIVFILGARELLNGKAAKSASRMKKGMLIALAAQAALLLR